MKNKVINLFGETKAVENTDKKYSELLIEFLTPFVLELDSLETYEDIIDFSTKAWNLGNMKQYFIEEEVDEPDEDIFKDFLEDDFYSKLLKKMIEYKISDFSEYTNFIIDFELKEADGKTLLTLTTEERKQYMDSIMEVLQANFMEEDLEYEDGEIFIDRSAIIIRPKQGFIDWLNSVFPEDGFEYSNFVNPTIYLVDDEIEDLEKWLRKKFDTFFMLELEKWNTNINKWPKSRNYKMFREWFEVSISGSVFDLEKRPIFKF